MPQIRYSHTRYSHTHKSQKQYTRVKSNLKISSQFARLTTSDTCVHNQLRNTTCTDAGYVRSPSDATKEIRNDQRILSTILRSAERARDKSE
jgi:hypothetical protein